MKQSHYDVAIIGSGIAGTMLGAILAKQKLNVVIIDAGTSEDGGALVGDVDPACADKCSLFTPVPGGVGPMTVMMLMRNTVQATKSLY